DLLAGLPRSLDELDHHDLQTVAAGPKGRPERRGRLPLAVPRVDDDEAEALRLTGSHALARHRSSSAPRGSSFAPPSAPPRGTPDTAPRRHYRFGAALRGLPALPILSA